MKAPRALTLLTAILFIIGCTPVASSTVVPFSATPMQPKETPPPTETHTPEPSAPPVLNFEMVKSTQEFTFRETFQGTLGDLDGDGDLDVFFANPLMNASAVWINDGTGTFTDTGQELTKYVHSVGLADFDEDGDLDAFIVCSEFSEHSKVYLNDGIGTFTDSGQDLGDSLFSAMDLNLLDFNSDGHTDAHVEFFGPNDPPNKIYLNDGTGTFSDSGLLLDEHVITWGDLDGDGDIDYFGKRYGVGYVVRLNNNGQFSDGWQLEDSQATHGSITLTDFDGDGDLDALVSNGYRDAGSFPTRLFWNDGSGNFTDSKQQINQTMLAEFAVGDLDLDGDPDVFVANMDRPNEIWLNEGGNLIDSGLRLGENTDLSGKASLGDLDGDGDLDVVVGRFNGGAEIWFNQSSLDAQPHSDNFSMEKSPQEFNIRATFQAALGDLDGDGDLDAVFANLQKNNSAVWLNDGSGNFIDTGQQLTQYGHGASVGDFDEDGDLDAVIVCHQFVTSSKIYLNDGNGNMLDSGQDFGDRSISAADVNLLDLNGDGHIDVHIMYYSPDGLPDKVYLNDGQANFSDSALALDEDTIAWGDLDGDGDVDYFGKRWGTGYNVQLNGGNGQFSAGWQMADSQSTVGSVVLADFDNDGDLDALVANGHRETGSYPSNVLWNDGTGSFTDSGQLLNGTVGAELAVGDLDLDGDLDVFVANMDLPNEIWLNEGGEFFDSGLRLGEAADMSGKASLGDLDGDGDLDAVIGRFNGGAEIWFNHSSLDAQTHSGNHERYFSQTPLGMEVEVFAPGIVSIADAKDYNITISPNLQEIFFTRRTPFGRNDRLYYTRLEEGALTTPESVSFSYDTFETDACFTPDGMRLYFNSRRPLPGQEGLSSILNVWFVDRIETGWSAPQFLGPSLNDYHPIYFSFATDGTRYFTRSFPKEIWYAELQDGEYREAQRLPDEINNLPDISHPAIAPNETFLIVDSFFDRGGPLSRSLYISFRNPDGSWTEMVSMQDVLKAFVTDICAMPRISPDGKFLFFEKYNPETDQADIYWVSTEIIESLRPEGTE